MSLAIMNNAAVIIYVQVFMKCMFSLAFPDDTVVKNPPENVGDSRDRGSISGLGGSPGEGSGNPLQYSCLENSMDKGAWFYGVAKSQTQLSTHAHIFITLGSIPSNQIAESHGNSMCKLSRNYQRSPKAGAPFSLSRSSVSGFQCLPVLSFSFVFVVEPH